MVTDKYHSASHSSMRGSPLSRRTGRTKTSPRSNNRCPARSRRDGRSTRTATRSTWTTSSRRTTHPRRTCRSCYRQRTNGSRARNRRDLEVGTVFEAAIFVYPVRLGIVINLEAMQWCHYLTTRYDRYLTSMFLCHRISREEVQVDDIGLGSMRDEM